VVLVIVRILMSKSGFEDEVLIKLIVSHAALYLVSFPDLATSG
jgi:hypothetical protein